MEDRKGGNVPLSLGLNLDTNLQTVITERRNKLHRGNKKEGNDAIETFAAVENIVI